MARLVRGVWVVNARLVQESCLCGVGGELKRCECVHGATQAKLLQGLGLPEVVDVLEAVGEQKVKVVLRRESEWCVVGGEGKRPSGAVECSELEECEKHGGPVCAGRGEWEVGAGWWGWELGLGALLSRSRGLGHVSP